MMINKLNVDITIYILLPVHNRRQITERFLDCLLNQTFQNFYLILIDDGSIDGTAESIGKVLSSEKLTIISGKGNWWWAGSLQQGYNWLQSRKNKLNENDIVLIINDDTIFGKNFLAIGQQILCENQNTFLLAECFDINDGRLIDRGIHIEWNTLSFNKINNIIDINCLSTRGLFFKAKDFFIVGGFYPILLPHYLSDYEFTTRSFNKGFKLITHSNLKLYCETSLTGFHLINEKGFFKFLKIYFSKKNPNNPFYWIVFVILASPKRYKFILVLKIFYNSIKMIIKQLIGIFK